MARYSLFDSILDSILDNVLDEIEPAARGLARSIIDRAKDQAQSQDPAQGHGRKGTGSKRKARPNPAASGPTPRPASTLYDVLEISSRASQETIAAAWKSLAKKYHPDTTRDMSVMAKNMERMKEINHAHTVLSDPGQRKRYDRTIGL